MQNKRVPYLRGM